MPRSQVQLGNEEPICHARLLVLTGPRGSPKCRSGTTPQVPQIPIEGGGGNPTERAPMTNQVGVFYPDPQLITKKGAARDNLRGAIFLI